MSFSKAKRLGLTFKGKPANKIDLSTPVVSMTPAEQEFADSVIREHFAEDRTEIIQQPRSSKRRTFYCKNDKTPPGSKEVEMKVEEEVDVTA